jgi:hypothetical protein
MISQQDGRMASSKRHCILANAMRQLCAGQVKGLPCNSKTGATS